MHRSYRYRIYPTKRQAAALENQLAFACDFYNAALEQRIWAWRTWNQRVTRFAQDAEIKTLKPAEMNTEVLGMALHRLDLAFTAFFRRLSAGETPGFPRYKATARYNTLSWRRGKGGAAIRDGRLRIQGVGHIKVRWHRDLPSEPRQTRITRKHGRWYVCFAVDVEPVPLPSTGRKVGIDVGVNRLASLSTGKHLPGPRAQRAGAQKVRRHQRAVARCELGSARRRRAIQRFARAKEHERNRRLDRAHKISRGLVNRFDLIAMEDLRIANMLHANRGLTREILDQGWGLLAECTRYKAESAGREFVLVDPRNTSRTCAECGAVDAASRKGPHFTCTSCGHYDHADVNAARNILARAVPSDANARDTALSEKSTDDESLKETSEPLQEVYG